MRMSCCLEIVDTNKAVSDTLPICGEETERVRYSSKQNTFLFSDALVLDCELLTFFLVWNTKGDIYQNVHVLSKKNNCSSQVLNRSELQTS